MIKTTSFAPPRARSGATHAASRTLRASSRKSLSAGETPVAKVRSLSQSAQTPTAKMPRPFAKKVAPDASQPNLFEDVEIEPVQVPVSTKIPAKTEAVRTAKAKIVTAKMQSVPETSPKEIKVASATSKIEVVPPEIALKIEAAPKAKAKPKSVNPRAKRAKVPDNLAEQYGAKVAKRAEMPEIVVLEPETPKRRLTKTERQARRDLMKPDDVLARLQAAQNIPLRQMPVEKREKGWKFQCGRCGTTSYFQTPGGVCECGALAIRE